VVFKFLYAMSVHETTFTGKLSDSFSVLFNEVSSYTCKNGDFTSSAIVESVGSLWSVRIYPSGTDRENSGWLSCFLVNESSSPVTASYSITLKDDRGQGYGPYQSVGVQTFCAVDGEGEMGGIDKVCVSRRHESIAVDIRVATQGSQVNRRLEKLPAASNNKSCALDGRASLLPLLLSRRLSDFTIVARRMGSTAAREETEEEWVNLPVHKLVLSLRSPVLKTMLDSGMAEANGGELRIADCDAAVVQEFVNFLYAGTCTAGGNTGSLFVLAHRYEMPELQRLCEHHLVTGLTAANALEALSLADLYQLAELRKRVLTYIGRNATALLKSRALSPELCQEVLCALSGVDIGDALQLDTDKKRKRKRKRKSKA
jgi:hypothetical protein